MDNASWMIPALLTALVGLGAAVLAYRGGQRNTREQIEGEGKARRAELQRDTLKEVQEQLAAFMAATRLVLAYNVEPDEAPSGPNTLYVQRFLSDQRNRGYRDLYTAKERLNMLVTRIADAPLRTRIQTITGELDTLLWDQNEGRLPGGILMSQSHHDEYDAINAVLGERIRES